MAKKKPRKEEDDDVDFDEDSDEILDEYDDIAFRKTSHKHSSNARRRHEQLKEDRELERLLGNDYQDWDYGGDYVDWD